MMRFAATFAVPLTGLALILCPVAKAQTDPNDALYFKSLANYVGYQGRVTQDEMIAKGHMACDTIRNNPTKAGVVSARDAITRQGVLTQAEANAVVTAAEYAYCPEFTWNPGPVPLT